MNNNSWLHLQEQDDAYALPADLARQDDFGARDCGWVEQMLPFIEHLCPPGGNVLDPFCGFGTTLVAAHLAGRKGIGIELVEQRVDIVRERLRRLGAHDQQLIQGDASVCAADLPAVDLILSNIPYFGCSWTGRDDAGDRAQLYTSASYADFLCMLQETLKALRCCLKPEAYIVLFAENLRIGGHFVPLAWDVARLLAERFELLEERILVYENATQPLPHGTMRSNRSHEYALLARNASAPLDLGQALTLLRELRSAFPDFIIYGSFARWLIEGDSAKAPADVDLLLPEDSGLLQGMIAWLESRGFSITCWGAPLTSHAIDPISAASLQAKHYLRAVRLTHEGSLCRIDLCFRDSHLEYHRERANGIELHGLLAVLR